jgi:hypothetical protein
MWGVYAGAACAVLLALMFGRAGTRRHSRG